MRTLRLALGLVLAAAACLARAQQTLEVIPLKHATVEQVLPALRPLLEPGGVLTGERGQLIVRASPENISDLRLALEVLDRAARRLQISVRFDDASADASRALDARARIGTGGSEADLRAREARSSGVERIDQRVQAMEGGHAFIVLGQSRPLRQRQLIRTPGGVVSQETFVMQDAATGFEVVPRLSGDRVFLDVVAQREAFASGPPAVRGERVTSSASGRLGEWFELGAFSTRALREGGGFGSAGSVQSGDTRRVWVKVEEIVERRP